MLKTDTDTHYRSTVTSPHGEHQQVDADGQEHCVGPNLPQRNINAVSKSSQQDFQGSESQLMISWYMGTGDSTAEVVAEHSCIFSYLQESTKLKLNKVKLETAAELHTGHPHSYYRRSK